MDDYINESALELVIFNVGEIICALKSIEVQEIIKTQKITTVYQAPDEVEGVINLRGLIVTIVNMRKKFHLEDTSRTNDSRIIIVKSEDEKIGLLVDQVDDILFANPNDVEPAPTSINGLKKDYFIGIYKSKDQLVAIINIEEILKL